MMDNDVDDLFNEINNFTLKSLSLDDDDDDDKINPNSNNNDNINNGEYESNNNDNEYNNDNGYSNSNENYNDGNEYNDEYNNEYNEEYTIDVIEDEPDWIELAGLLEDSLLNRASYQPLYVLTHNGGYSTEALFTAIATANGNVENAMKIVVSAEEQIYNCKPCRHLMGGGCLRNDCKFDHDLSAIPCKYWILDCKCSSQQNGEYCPFLHDFSPHVLETIENNSKSLILDTEEEFPSLPTKPKNNKTEKITASSLSQTLFQNVGNNITDQVITTKPTKNISSVKSNDQLLKKGKEISLSEWVESGQNVSKEYEKYRSEARTLAIGRNALLQEATNAYLAGKKDIAKNLSLQGQKMNREMAEYHVKAAKNIFLTRNQEASLKKGKIDMHGLHVAEAILVLDELIPLYKSSMSSITVITGTGHHSVDKHRAGVLLPNIEKYIKKNNMKYKTVIDPNNGLIGGVIIDI